jgi:beta-N-acetylhexosaminidase
VSATASLRMLAFGGTEVPAALARTLSVAPPAGITLFRQHNVRSAAQVRALTSALQAATRPSDRPLLIAADQEGGQLIGLGDETTQFPGAMALGAIGDGDLAERVGRAIARELRALGVNVNYSPVCDLATNPDNPGLGIRSFGDDPAAAGELAAATVRGLQAEGVAATAKHFPGKGDAAVDTHHELAVVPRSLDEMRARELVPFKAAIDAGTWLVMSGHFALPSLTGNDALPATLAPEVLTELLRNELRYDGLVTTDALDMKALAQGAAQTVEVIAAIRAGADLLLETVDDEAAERIGQGLAQASLRGLIDPAAVTASAERVRRLRGWIDGFPDPAPSVVGCAEHQSLAREVAERSLTLVRNDDGVLPVRLGPDARVAVITTRPADLTPADTSKYVHPALGAAIRRRHPRTDEYEMEGDPRPGDAAALRNRVRGHQLVIVGTLNASQRPAQAELVASLLATGIPTITVALRAPWDLSAYPQSRTHVCAYGILGPTTEALAAALFGEIPFRGHLPVSLGELHARGHGLVE